MSREEIIANSTPKERFESAVAAIRFASQCHCLWNLSEVTLRERGSVVLLFEELTCRVWDVYMDALASLGLPIERGDLDRDYAIRDYFSDTFDQVAQGSITPEHYIEVCFHVTHYIKTKQKEPHPSVFKSWVRGESKDIWWTCQMCGFIHSFSFDKCICCGQAN